MPEISQEDFFLYNPFPQMKELWEILQRPDDEIDLAYSNLLIASTIPELKDLDVNRCLGEIDRLVEEIRKRTENAKRTDSRQYRCDAERDLLVLCTLVHEMGIVYTEEFQKTELSDKESKGLYQEPTNLFQHGILLEKRGSCVNMPLIYLALAERLDYPIYGVCIGKHLFVRWDDGSFRMNVETTITSKIATTTDDTVYLETEGLSREEVQGTSWLRNLSKREMIGVFFSALAGHKLASPERWYASAAADLLRSNALLHDNPYTQKNLTVARQMNTEKQLSQLGIIDGLAGNPEARPKPLPRSARKSH